MTRRKKSESARRFDEEVGRRIERARKARQMTARELAREAGISQPALCFYEGGERRCAAHILARLAEALDTEVADLIPKFTMRKFPEKMARTL